MNVYRTTQSATTDLSPVFSGTLAEAHAVAKALPKHQWSEVRIDLVEVATDKAGVIALLNNEAVTTDLRTWSLTSRGGLIELGAGE